MAIAQSDRVSRQDFLVLGAGCVIVAVAFTVLWSANDSWVYSSITDLDTWYYVGLAQHWGDPPFLAENYKASRLPWVLYEFLFYHLWRPENAVPIVQLSCYLLFLVGNYLFMRRLFDPLVAGLTSVSLLLWTHVQANGGADYHNTLSGPLFVWCAYATLHMMQARVAAPWFVIAGGLYLALVVTNPLYVNLSLALLVLGLFGWWQHQKDVRYLLRCAVFVIVGAAIAFVLLGLINWRFHRNFIFTAQIFAMAKSLLLQGENRWWKGWGWWALEQRSAYLGAFGAMLIIAGCELASLLRLAHWEPVHRRAAMLHAIYLFHALLWTVFQTIGQTTLDFPYFAYPLWVLWFWSLAAVLAVRVTHSHARVSPAIAGIAMAIMAALTVVALVYGFPLHALALQTYRYTIVQAGVLVMAFYLALVGAAFVRSGAVVAAFVLFYPAVDLLSQDWPSQHAQATCKYGVDGFTSVIDANRFISRHVDTLGNARMWFDENEPLPDQPHCPRNIGYGLLGYVLGVGSGNLGPSWPMRPADAIPDGDILEASDSRYVIGLFTSVPEKVEKIRQRFAHYGIPLDLIDHRDFKSQTIAYSVYLLRPAERTEWTPGIHVRSAGYLTDCKGSKPVKEAKPVKETKPVNVTSAAANACLGRKQCDFTVPADELGNSPPACAKDFGVSWVCGGDLGNYESSLHQEANHRGISISIACPEPVEAAPGIHIRAASYGADCAGFNAVDVSAAVSITCIGRERCDFTVPAETFGNLPPTCTRYFAARWVCGGERGTYESSLRQRANDRGISASIVCPKK